MASKINMSTENIKVNTINSFLSNYLDSINEKFTYFKSNDIVKLLRLADIEQKVEISTISLLVALGGKNMLRKEGITFRKSFNLPYLIYSNEINFYLLTALGDILLGHLASIGNNLAKEYVNLLGGKIINEGGSLKRVSRQRRAFLLSVKNIYNVSYADKVEILDLLTNLIDKDITLDVIKHKREVEESKIYYKDIHKTDLFKTKFDLNYLTDYDFKTGKSERKNIPEVKENLTLNDFLTKGTKEHETIERYNVFMTGKERKEEAESGKSFVTDLERMNIALAKEREEQKIITDRLAKEKEEKERKDNLEKIELLKLEELKQLEQIYKIRKFERKENIKRRNKENKKISQKNYKLHLTKLLKCMMH